MSVRDFERLGYNVVIFPVTAFRAMMKAVKGSLLELKQKGTQRDILGSLMTRTEFYDLIDYKWYENTDKRVADAAKKLVKGRNRAASRVRNLDSNDIEEP
jgi:methylisocitrate lyase